MSLNLGGGLASSPSPSVAASPITPPSTLTISADERLLLCSLIETQQFGPAVKAIYDRQWYTNPQEYQWILQESVLAKQNQIKTICEEHYAEFLAGIEHLLSVKLDLSELRSLAQSLNLSVQQSGRSVLASARQLNEQRRLRFEINHAKQIIQSCASLIALARKAKQQIFHSKYFSALKTLNQLQRILHVATTNFQKSNPTGNAASAAAAKDSALTKSTQPSSSSSSSATDTSNSIRFEFLRQLERQIPLLTGKIKENVSAEFTQWLNGISKRSQAIGELALAQLDEHLSRANQKQAAHKDHKHKHKKHHHKDKHGKHYDSEEEDEDDEEIEENLDANLNGHTSANLFDAIPINFTPIYQCLHIYEHLNLAEQFQNLYKEKRKNQLMEVVNSLANITVSNTNATSTPPTQKPSTGSSTAAASSASSAAQPPQQRDMIETYSTVYAAIAGFFIIEDNILKSGNELISRAEIDTLYEKVQFALIGYLTQHFSLCAFKNFSPGYLLQLKYVTVLFCKILDENFLGHDSGPLLKFLEDNRTIFENLLLKKFQTEIRNIFSKEKWEPLGIVGREEYTMFVLNFKLQDESISVDFPCTMPFSISVPLLSRVLTNFVEDYFQYAKDLDEGSSNGGGGDHSHNLSSGSSSSSNQISSSWKIYILKALDRALIGEINKNFLELLNLPNLPISQTVQFSINAQVLSELTCTYLENMVENYGSSGHHSDELGREEAMMSPKSASSINSNSSSSPYTLQARQQLLSTKLRCEDFIFELISSKIDQFLDLSAGFNWLPDTVRLGPSDYIQDLIAYLETTFYHMSFMPDAVREAVHFTSCKHIADTFMETLASAHDSHCKKFNILAIANLNQDLHVVEAFAQRCPIQNLVETFSEIRQLIDLLLSGEIEALLDPSIRSAKYPHLSSHKLIKILDKFKDISLFNLSTPPQYKKLKKKNVETVVKALQKANK